LDIYRLVDENNNEITPEELTDRYLSDPETCFKVQDPTITQTNTNYSKNVLINSVLPRVGVP
jgi:hypothetical protein